MTLRDGLFLQVPKVEHSADAQDRGVPRSSSGYIQCLTLGVSLAG